MAFWWGRKNLACFYCGSKSKYVQDGSVREWECTKCDAVNYLDENGEITDPPVAELHKVSSSLKYAQAVPKYDLAAPSRTENSSFCDACLKNQHLFTASLAQYIPDDSNPLIDRKYIKFREDLEKRYPQVCEDCAPNVLERYKQSQYAAKADHVRRLMDRTRKHGGPPKSQRSWIDTIGRTLYFLGIFGQVCWNVVGLYRGIRPRILDICDTDEIVFEEQPSGVQHVSATLVSLTCWVTNLNPPFAESLRNSIFILMSNSRLIPRLVGWSFWLSVVSVWWNPKMKQSISGFDSHLKGLSDWYKYNVILLVARIIFCSLMGSVINKLDASATLGAHTFMLGFTIFVMIVAPKSIKSDTSRLFVPLTPEKLRPYVGRSKATVHKAGDITPNPLARNALSPAGNGVKASGVCQDSRAGVLGGSPRSRKRGCPSPSSITNLMPASFQIDDAEGEEMDWDPAPPQHLNFEPTQAPRSSQLFIQPTASVPTEPSPFRGKLPPAPISMAHKLRNPPNQPRLLPPTQEAKENFFDRMSGRQIVATDDDDEAISTSGRQSDVKFAPPRFFHDDGDDPTGLTEAFESAFRLGPDEDSVRKKNHLFEIKNIDQTHLSRALVLLLVFFVWEYALAYPSENRAILPPISMVVCGFVALLSIYNYTVSPWAKKQSKSIVVLGGIFATMQTFAAGYIIYDMRARTAHSEIPHLQGALLIGTMLIQEACFIGFIKG